MVKAEVKLLNKSKIAEKRKLEKQKTQLRLNARDIKEEKLGKNNLVNNQKKPVKRMFKKATEEELAKDNRIIWTNLNYKDKKTDLEKFRPYLIRTISFSKNFYFLELFTITSQEWKANFKYEVKISPQCLKSEKNSLVYLDTLVYIDIEKENLKSLCKCDCKNCFNRVEYNSIINLQKEFQKNNESKIKKIEIEREALITQIEIPPK